LDPFDCGARFEMSVGASSRFLATLLIVGFVCGAWACGATAVEVPDTESGPDGQLLPIRIDSGFGLDGGLPFDSESFDSGFDGEPIESDLPDSQLDGESSESGFDGELPDVELFDGEPPDAGATWDGGVPVNVASGEQPVSLAVDDSNVYWQNAMGTVLDCPLSGCANNVPTLLALNGAGNGGGNEVVGLESITASSSTAFFLNSSLNLDLCASGGCDLAPSKFWDNGGGGSTVALVSDDSNVYFSSFYSVFSCPIGSNCLSSYSTLVITESGALNLLALSASEVFYVDGSVDSTQKIHAIPIAGGTSRVVCKSSSGLLALVNSMVVSGGYVYFTTPNDKSGIYGCPAAGGGVPTIFVNDESPYGLAADGANLYWTTNRGLVGTCPIGATCVGSRTIASGQDSPQAIAVNSTAVYWTTATAIYSAAK
jgi:hypothetical protein